MIKGFLDIPWSVWAAVALAVAVIYTFVWPRKAASASAGLRFFILRWGHALTWILLAVNFLLRGVSPSLNGVATLFALAGGALYLLFIAMAYVVKR
jgi:hypothetical protein